MDGYTFPELSACLGREGVPASPPNLNPMDYKTTILEMLADFGAHQSPDRFAELVSALSFGIASVAILLPPEKISKFIDTVGGCMLEEALARSKEMPHG